MIVKKLNGYLHVSWEYPNQDGIGCNEQSPDDAENFLLFLQELRKAPIGKGLILTAAVGSLPFNGSDGNPMSDVSGFGEVLDHIGKYSYSFPPYKCELVIFSAIMVYDFYGSDSVGPNAPLDDSCAPADKKVGSALNSVTQWTNAGFRPEQVPGSSN